jgi:2,4-dienoyl-CoA reductase-like NADH-dependent reductase (Old Yellow Enzyme family)
MSALFTPLRLRDLELSNRIVVSPMCQYSADEGLATDWHLVHLGNLSMSGAGLLFVEATAVEPSGRITPGCLGLWSEAHAAALGKAVDVVRRHGVARLGIQLAHAGRKASCAVPWKGGKQLALAEGGWPTWAPSPLPFLPAERPPVALEDDDIARLKAAFFEAAGRAARLGFDVVELHCAHGYLLHEFLSPLSNQRTDRYGGTLENRMRLPLEIFDEVRRALPAHTPVGVRVSATDWMEGGWSIDDTVAFSRALAARGCDFVDCSSGGLHPAARVPAAPGFQVPFARRVRAEAHIKAIAVGMITEPSQAEAIIAGGEADLVALARAMLWDPRWGWRAAQQLGARVVAPPQVLRANPEVLAPAPTPDQEST